ncbi:CBS domain-containing protein [Qipengyuania citrea]|jgi:CBS domain-containing protein|uniref:CBS domain-containing protein n=1 Tax=Qipengyuania citrea TaxID=225971 RepID=A0ABY4U5C7_9SPHN|nr:MULTISPECIES: CBS domain-containing protein [Erythrobacteraceae]MAB46084.1 histidine kinase [Sphingomonadaceae bacterium]MAP68528.1 histidine kinase [Erythrobacteraceae bacterium]MBL4896280.1 CBS domain-containing protein [Erythrobacter sp.]MBV01315.1 histidine kinase [Citromicrobium sp.]MEC7889261.1 CBS domain-containing protein [Pseudomonadota bacterium]QPL40195.1 CBS domain-containing protein [Erythrobacter sp. A30-3]|tara:strand:+ start:1177 stop:1608 length:432 start_codon:yes stop_codon:yes gene_type:complete
MEISRLIEGRASSNVISSTVDAPVREAIALLASKRIGAVPIMEGGRIVGIFSERDVIYRLADEGDACLERPIGEVMTAPAITVERSATVLDALALMTKRRIRHLPVVDGETMCGFISIGDLVKARLDEIQHEAEAMREYIRTA